MLKLTCKQFINSLEQKADDGWTKKLTLDEYIDSPEVGHIEFCDNGCTFSDETGEINITDYTKKSNVSYKIGMLIR